MVFTGIAEVVVVVMCRFTTVTTSKFVCWLQYTLATRLPHGIVSLPLFQPLAAVGTPISRLISLSPNLVMRKLQTCLPRNLVNRIGIVTLVIKSYSKFSMRGGTGSLFACKHFRSPFRIAPCFSAKETKTRLAAVVIAVTGIMFAAKTVNRFELSASRTGFGLHWLSPTLESHPC